MIKIYHSPIARSLRVVWLCEEMGLAYETETVKFGAFTPEFLALNPLGTLPLMVDGPVVMIESIAMMMYIMAKHGPSELAVDVTDPAYAKYMQFLMFGEAGMAMYGNPLVATKFRAPEEMKANWTVDYLKSAFSKRFAYLDSALGDYDYIVDNRFTAADISVGYAIGMAGFVDVAEGLTDRLKAYHHRLIERPAFKRAQAMK
jgi:glutathione S-transferase